MRVRSLFVLVLCLSCSVALASDVADAFWAKQNKEALRDLERGAPLKQIEAVGRLGPDFAAQTAPVLARHLANPDPVIRLAAAEELWQQAARKPDAFATLKPALRIALDDGDGMRGPELLHQQAEIQARRSSPDANDPHGRPRSIISNIKYLCLK